MVSNVNDKKSPNTRAGSKPRGRSSTPKRKERSVSVQKEPLIETGPRPVEKKPIPDLNSWLSMRSIMVAESNQPVILWAEGRGIPVKPGKRIVKDHPISALCREAATLEVLKMASKGLGNRMKVLDVFGANRTRAFDPRTSSFILPVVGGGTSRDKMAIEVVASPDTPVQGDNSRGKFVRVPFPPENDFDVAIFVDVYQSGSSWNIPLESSFVKTCLSKTKNGQAFWIGRKFEGLAGADVFEGCGDEQVFFKDLDGLIVSSPDPNTIPYPKHPFPEWVFERTFDGIDISPITQIGPYAVIRFSLANILAQSIGVIHKENAGSVQKVPVNMAHVTRLFGYPIFVKHEVEEIPCHLLALETLGAAFRRRVVTGTSGDSAQMAVQKFLEADPEMKALKLRFPKQFGRIVSGTVEAVLYHRREEDNSRMYGLRKTYLLSEEKLVSARASSAPKGHNEVMGQKQFFIGAGGFILTGLSILAAVKTRNVRSLRLAAGVVIGSAVAVKLAGGKVIECGAIVESKPLVSALIEEAVWYGSPLTGSSLVGLELFREFSRSSQIPVKKIMLHSLLFCLRKLPGGWFLATAFHLMMNCRWKQQQSEAAFFENFKKHYSQGKVIEGCVSKTCAIPTGTRFPSYTSLIKTGPDNFRGEISIKVDGISCTIEEAFHLLEVGGRNETFPILITNRLLHQPANNEINLLAAVLHRVHNDPFAQNVHPSFERHRRWRALGFVVSEYLPSVTTSHITERDNWELMGKKGNRIRDAWVDEENGHSCFMGKTINLKWNETLSVSKDVAGVLTMKPRAIQNLPALTHARMGGYARQFAFELHNCFDGKVQCIFGQPVRVFFASGYTQEQLTEIGRAMENGETVFAMSGDDSVVAWGHLAEKHNLKPFGEADQSKFDHTQDDGPMKHYMGQLLSKIGLPDSFIAEAYWCCSSGYSVRKGRLTCKGRAGVQMPTGVTTTTSFNSMSTFGFFVYCLSAIDSGRVFNPVQFGAELGFDVKYFERDTFTQATFLKGWWQTADGGCQWLPLPSAVIKLGKVLKDPVEITKFTRRGKKMHRTANEAVAMCAFSLSSSYGEISSHYPILGAFVETLKRNGDSRGIDVQGLQESWKPNMGGINVDRPGVLQSIELRYGITELDVIRVEKLLNSICNLPAYIEDPVFDLLCEVDY